MIFISTHDDRLLPKLTAAHPVAALNHRHAPSTEFLRPIREPWHMPYQSSDCCRVRPIIHTEQQYELQACLGLSKDILAALPWESQQAACMNGPRCSVV